MVVIVMSLFLFFFFKQKTAYEMRISDWSSDVCSSDLVFIHAEEEQPVLDDGAGRPDVGLVERAVVAAPAIALVDGAVPVELVIPCRCPGRRLHREFGA